MKRVDAVVTIQKLQWNNALVNVDSACFDASRVLDCIPADELPDEDALRRSRSFEDRMYGIVQDLGIIRRWPGPHRLSFFVPDYLDYREDRLKEKPSDDKARMDRAEAAATEALALERLNIRWQQEDLDGILQGAGVKPDDISRRKLAEKINNGFRETLIGEINERISLLAQEVAEEM